MDLQVFSRVDSQVFNKSWANAAVFFSAETLVISACYLAACFHETTYILYFHPCV